MKLYESEKNCSKKCAISLRKDNNDDIDLVAVDADTGDCVASLFYFKMNGEIHLINSAFDALQLNGYDPCEHNNQFNKLGAIKIS